LDSLERTTISNVVLTTFQNTERFVGSVWTISVNAELPAILNCQVEARMIVNDRDTGKIIPLLWQVSDELPTPMQCWFYAPK
jgi:hypothetical protein